MTFAQLIKEKKLHSIKLCNQYSLPKANKALGFVKISDKKVLKKLLKGLSGLKTNFIIMTDQSFDTDSDNIVFVSNSGDLNMGADFIICDDSIGGISECFEKGIAPIMVKDSSMSSILTEFNPMRNEGNAYLYNSLNEWAIFATLIRYLENYRFTFDNKNLVKNIFES